MGRHGGFPHASSIVSFQYLCTSMGCLVSTSCHINNNYRKQFRVHSMCYDYESIEKCMTFTILILDRVFLCACTRTFAHTFAQTHTHTPLPTHPYLHIYLCSVFSLSSLPFTRPDLFSVLMFCCSSFKI